jgi:hypothetical protein
VYKNWLETYKVIHTVTQSDGTILVHNYKTYKFN